MSNCWQFVRYGLASGLAVLLLCQAGCASLPVKEWFAKPRKSGSSHRLTKRSADPKPRSGNEATGESLVMELAKGRSYEKSARWDKAREVYDELRAKYPKDPSPLHRLGIVADKQRRHTEAQRWYTRAIQLDGTNPQVFSDLGYCFYLQGKLDKAESALLKAVRLDPNDARALNNLGMVLGHQKRYNEALEAFAEAGSDADAYYNLAFVYASQEQDERAEMCFRQSLALDPQHEQAREALAAFKDYESRGHAGLGDEALLAGSQAGMVPFKEAAAGDVQATGHQSESAVPTRQATRLGRDLHERSQGLLNRRMSSQRDESQRAESQQQR